MRTTAITWILLSTPGMLEAPLAWATTATEDDSPTTTTTPPTGEPGQPEPLPAEPPGEEITITEEPTAPPTTEEPISPGATAGDLATDTPAPQEPGPMEPLVGPNATGVAGGTNVTGATTPQQTVSNIISNIRATEPDANQTEIAELEQTLPILVDALTQGGGTPVADLTIKRTCEYEYDANGNRTKKTCTTTVSL